MRFLHTKVRTLDSHSVPGRPMEFEFDGKGFFVEEILDHWKEAHQNSSFYPQEYYKVQASDRQLYILRYSTLFRSWWAKRCGVNQ